MNTTRTLITLTVALCSLAVAASALAGPPRSDLELTLGGPASGGLNDVVSVMCCGSSLTFPRAVHF